MISRASVPVLHMHIVKVAAGNHFSDRPLEYGNYYGTIKMILGFGKKNDYPNPIQFSKTHNYCE
ncbi:MAG: hypothetical protein PHF18_04480 [Methanosarcina sp.]|uniref:hypothetical protein n=1 Tax=Methanosarcina sp. TaxID=2213 RepID=UPI002639DCDE|nr:hypothetical protein [Methanosarcina sp.]MDD3246103.1 hypothetical protein [Methanosarcina sp.]